MGRRRRAWLVNGSGIRLQNGRRLPGYYVRWWQYLPGGGRRNRSKHFLQQNLARRWLRRHNARIDLDQLDEIIPVLLEEAVGEFEQGGARWAKDTRVQYGSALGMLQAIIGPRYVHEIRGADIDQFIAERLAVSRESTVAKHIRSLRVFFRWAIKRSYMQHNPLTHTTALPKDHIIRQRPLITDAILTRLIGAIDTQDRRIAIWLAMTSGLDRRCIEGLSPSAIDVDIPCIRFIRRKTGRPNAVPIHPALVPLLVERMRETPASTPLLVGLQRGRHKRDWWNEARQAAGLPNLLFRDLRAVAASRLQQIGRASLREAQDLLGHASAQTTAAHYWVPTEDALARFRQLPLPGFPSAPRVNEQSL